MLAGAALAGTALDGTTLTRIALTRTAFDGTALHGTATVFCPDLPPRRRRPRPDGPPTPRIARARARCTRTYATRVPLLGPRTSDPGIPQVGSRIPHWRGIIHVYNGVYNGAGCVIHLYNDVYTCIMLYYTGVLYYTLYYTPV